MQKSPLVKIRCRRCSKEIFTTTMPGMVNRPSYRRFGSICSACLTEQEQQDLSREMAEETALFARKYRILQKVKWGSGDLDERGEQIMQYIWTRYYYSQILPVMCDIMKEFPDADVEIQVEKLVKKGYLMPLY